MWYHAMCGMHSNKLITVTESNMQVHAVRNSTVRFAQLACICSAAVAPETSSKERDLPEPVATCTAPHMAHSCAHGSFGSVHSWQDHPLPPMLAISTPTPPPPALGAPDLMFNSDLYLDCTVLEDVVMDVQLKNLLAHVWNEDKRSPENRNGRL
jgi:hypothetical protein